MGPENENENENERSRRLDSIRAKAKRYIESLRWALLHAAETIVGTTKLWKRKKVGVYAQAKSRDYVLKIVSVRLTALEHLISTLRAHLSRLTTELSDHQLLLEELRSLRESDARALALKGQDIDHLRQEVERLAGEVEVLRGVVEEGLKERRGLRERLENGTQHDEAEADPAAQRSDCGEKLHASEQAESAVSEDEDESSIASQEHSPSPSPRPLSRLADRTMRTDHPTVGSSLLTRGDSLEPFVNEEELERISAEVEERRSERSHSISSDSHHNSGSFAAPISPSLSRVASPIPPIRSSRADDSLHSDRGLHIKDNKLVVPAPLGQSSRTSSPAPSLSASARGLPRPGAPTPGRALQNRTHSGEQRRTSQSQKAPAPEVPEPPFPQIRGSRLERLFFSAPEHNTNTCSVCHRRRRRTHRIDDGPLSRDWLADRKDDRHRRTATDNVSDGEGFAEDAVNTNLRQKSQKGRRDSGGGQRASDDRLPPQTVLARVLRELEDDFTHYKRSGIGFVVYTKCVAYVILPQYLY